MSTHSTTPPFADEPNLQTDDMLGRVFADSRRRTLLRVLASSERRVELDSLAERVVEAETGDRVTDAERFDRTLISLYHCHLPLLADAGLVDVEDEEGVFVRPDADALDRLV